VVAHPLTAQLPPPSKGLVPTAGPPPVLRALWARVAFDGDLTPALSQLEPWLGAPTLRRALVQVVYRPEQLTAANAEVHAAFARRHADKASTYLPFCLPGSPQFATMGAFATPHDCHGCVFYQGMACQGLGGDPAPWSALGSERLPLEDVARPVHAYGRDDFAGKRPLQYWLPERRHVAAIGAAVRAVGGGLWDLGGGNGFLAGLLAADEGLDVTVVDVCDAYPTPAGVRRAVRDVRATVAGAPRALLLSWPPTGDGFRDVVEAIDPDVVVYALDAEGFCGRRPGYAGVFATPDGLEWFAYPENDFRPLRGRPVVGQWRVRTYRDLRAGDGKRSGILQIRARVPLAPAAAATRYPWE
jgi:hypothetical protein